MRKWLIIALLLLAPIGVLAQTTDAIEGFCDLGSTSALVSGLGSTNKLQGLIPGCTVTVYLTGTQTLATIYADGSNTPLSNPFTATVTTSGSTPGSHWIFWAADNQGYDVVGSGGTVPNNYPSPITLCTDCKVGGGGGGGGSPCGIVNDVQTNAGGGNFGCDSGFLYNNNTTHTLYQNIFSAMLKVLVSDTTHSGVTTYGASNGVVITNTYATGVNGTLAATYGTAIPDNAPTSPGQVPIINSLTPVHGLLPTVWGTPNGAVSQEFMQPLFSTNAPSPTTTNDLVDTPLPTLQSYVLRGLYPSGIAAANVIQDVTCGIASTGPVSCIIGNPLPGDFLIAVISTVEGISVADTFTITDSNLDSYTLLDAITMPGLGQSAFNASYFKIPAGGILGLLTVTGTPANTSSNYATLMHVMEVSGVSAITAHAAGGSISTATISFPAVATASGSNFVLSTGYAYTTTNQQTYAPIGVYGATLSNSYNLLDSGGTKYFSIASQGAVITGSGTQTPQSTASQSSFLQGESITFTRTGLPNNGAYFFGLYRYLDLCQSGDFPCPSSISNGQTLTWNSTLQDWQASSAAPGVSFTNITTGTNSTATMTCGTGCTVTVSGSGVNNANEVNGAAVPASATVAATNSSKQVIAAGLTSADIWVGNGSNLPAAVAASGDVTLANTGAFTVTGVNGAAVAASAAPACTNSSRQITSCTATFTQTICSGTLTAPNGSSISSSACSTAVTATCTGVASTDTIRLGFQADPTSTTGYVPGAMVTLIPYYSTTNTIALKSCNNTGTAITPSSVTLNYFVQR